MSPRGAIFVPSSIKKGTNLQHPRPPQSLNDSLSIQVSDYNVKSSRFHMTVELSLHSLLPTLPINDRSTPVIECGGDSTSFGFFRWATEYSALIGVRGPLRVGSPSPVPLRALFRPQPTPFKPILQLVQLLAFLLQALFQQQVMDPFYFFNLFRLGLAYASRASVQDSLKVQPRDWDLVRPLWSSEELIEILQAPCFRPCERRNVPAADGAACTAAATADMAGVAAAAGVAAVVNTANFSPPGGGRWCRGIAFRYSPGSGCRFCR